MKLRLLAATLAAFALSSGAALAQSAAAASAAPNDKTTLSYAIGYDMARELAERNVDLDVSTIVRGVQDGYAKKTPTIAGEKLQASLAAFQKKMADQERANFERLARENKTKSDAFLASNRAKAGVTVMPSGVQYRVIEVGKGPKPTSASTVTVHLIGSVSDGRQFANTTVGAPAQNGKPASAPEPATFKLGEFPLAGLREAILQMPIGSHWEIAIPAEKAYGNDPRSPVGPGQALAFDVRLLSSK